MKKTAKQNHVLVCVTGQRDCARLIKAGEQIAEGLSVPMHVFSVQPESTGYAGDGEVLEFLRQRAREAKSDMTVYFSDDTVLITAGFAKQIHAVHIVTGMAGTPAGGFIEMLHKLLPKIPITMVAKDGMMHCITHEDRKEKVCV